MHAGASVTFYTGLSIESRIEGWAGRQGGGSHDPSIDIAQLPGIRLGVLVLLSGGMHSITTELTC